MTNPSTDLQNVAATFLSLVKLMVDAPDNLKLGVTSELDKATFQLRPDPKDAGKLIGQQGRTARSLRTILMAIGVTIGCRITLDIVSPDDDEISS